MAQYKEGDILTIDRDEFIKVRLADDLIVDPDWYDLPEFFTAKVYDEEYPCHDGIMWVDIYIDDGAWMCPMSAVKQTKDKAYLSRRLVQMYQEE